MSRYIIQCFCEIMGTCDNPLLTNHDSPNRNFSPISSFACLYQSLFHEVNIVQHPPLIFNY